MRPGDQNSIKNMLRMEEILNMAKKNNNNCGGNSTAIKYLKKALSALSKKTK